MKIGFNIKINLSLIEQSKCFAGKKGKYLDCTVFYDDVKGEYGDNGIINQAATKEEREVNKKASGVLLGNITEFWTDGKPRSSVPATSPPQDNMGQPKPKPVDDGFDDDIPF